MERLDVKLTDTNYVTWRKLFACLLYKKGLITKGIIGSDKLEITAGKETAVYADLMLNVEPHLFPVIENANGAMEALTNLETMFKGKTQARKTELKRQFNNIKMKDGEEVSRFIARTQELRHELVSVGHALGDDDVVDAVLDGLPKRFDMVVTAIQTADKSPDLFTLLAKLQLIDQRHKCEQDAAQGAAGVYSATTHSAKTHGKTYKPHNRHSDKVCYMVKGLPVTVDKFEEEKQRVCEPCIKGKQSCQPFKT
jgi:hypothetical protein